jgi:hypothetical protein
VEVEVAVIADLIVAGCCLVCALLLVCMLQVEFRRSSRAFRVSVSALAGTSIVYAILPWLPQQGRDVVVIAFHVALVAVLGLVRWRQLRTGRCGAR